jgi:GNAT superfamily N-acetyltransferase
MQPPLRPAVFVRRVRAEDAQTMAGFLTGLSVPSRRNRFHGIVNGASPKLVGYLVTADGIRHAGWVACIWGVHGEEIIGEAGWYVVDPERGSAELALSVLDSWQGSGVANRLMTTLIEGAREAGLRHLYGDVLDANSRMLAFMRRHGLRPGFDASPDSGVERVSCELTPTDEYERKLGI